MFGHLGLIYRRLSESVTCSAFTIWEVAANYMNFEVGVLGWC